MGHERKRYLEEVHKRIGQYMNREDIIQMAQEAQMPFYWRTGEITYLDKLERFAALIASAEREKFCAVLRQLHDSYSLASDSTSIQTRGQA